MADLAPRNMSAIKAGTATPAQMHEAILDIVSSMNNLGQQTSAAPVGTNPPPTPHSKLSVKGGGGIVDVAITDNDDSYRGKEHFFDYSQDGFKTWHTKSLGPAKNWRGQLGDGPFEVRSYAQHPTTGLSPMIYHPKVDTAGAQPAMQPGQGSGTGQSGYGDVPYTGAKVPIR